MRRKSAIRFVIERMWAMCSVSFDQVMDETSTQYKRRSATRRVESSVNPREEPSNGYGEDDGDSDANERGHRLTDISASGYCSHASR